LPAPNSKSTPKGVLLLFVRNAGLEPIYMQMSGGHLLPPVQKLVATTIFFLRLRRKKMQIESCCPFSAKQKMQASPVTRFLRSRKCRPTPVTRFLRSRKCRPTPVAHFLRSRKCTQVLLPAFCEAENAGTP